jgi:hypothetical protein
MPVERARPPRWLVRVGGIIAAWAMLALMVVLELLPDTPRTTRGWVLVLVLGPPVYAAAEWTSSRVFSDRNGARISSARFSVARVAVALVVTLVALAPFIWWSLRSAS